MSNYEITKVSSVARRAASRHALHLAAPALLAGLLAAGCTAPTEPEDARDHAQGDERTGEAADALLLTDRRDISAPSDTAAGAGVAVASWGVGRRDYFYIDKTTQTLMHGWSENRGVPTYFEPLPGVTLTGTPAAVSSADHYVDVVALGTDRRLYHLPYTPSGWSYWRAVASADAFGSPALASWGPGRLDVFYRSSGNELLHRYSNGGGWSGGAAENLHGVCTTDPSATSWGYGRLDVVVGNTSKGVSHIAYDGGWYGWDGAGVDESTWWKVYGAPAITSNGYGELDVFYTYNNIGIWGFPSSIAHTRFSGGSWSYPESSVEPSYYSPASTVTAVAIRGYPEVDVVSNRAGWRVFTESQY